MKKNYVFKQSYNKVFVTKTFFKKSFDSGEQLPGKRSLIKRLLVIVNLLLWVHQTRKSINATSCIK